MTNEIALYNSALEEYSAKFSAELMPSAINENRIYVNLSLPAIGAGKTQFEELLQSACYWVEAKNNKVVLNYVFEIGSKYDWLKFVDRNEL